jgi:SAM-dependent methyltransferase
MLTPHASSFRDPEGYVSLGKTGVQRFIATQNARERIHSLLTQPFFKQDLSAYVIPSHWDTQNPDVLVHETVPVITYPYEWSFDMLKDAALGQLTILECCIQNGFILKDGSGFNTLYHRGKMIFVDILSIDVYDKKQIWSGYAQFCKHFLFPLILEAKRGVFFQSFWRGSLDGIALDDIYHLLGGHSFLSLTLLRHVVLQRILGRAGHKSSKTMCAPHMPQAALLSFVRNLKTVVTSLHKQKKRSTWEDYAQNNSYTLNDQTQKESFITTFLEQDRLTQIVDLGCNTGHYTRLAAPFVERVVAVDYDPHCIDALYTSIKANECFQGKITPMVCNLMNPSPKSGWHLSERSDQIDRLTSDGFLALALVHHICIAENVPLSMFARFLKTIAPCGIVEWVSKDDPMVQKLLQHRVDIFNHYTQTHFETCLAEHFKIVQTITINNGTRTLYRVACG